MQTRQTLKHEMLKVLLDAESLVFAHSYPDRIPTLRINTEPDDGWKVSLGDPPGNAYVPPKGEVFITVGISADCLDYSDLFDLPDNERDEADFDLEVQATADHINECIDMWVEDAWEDLFDSDEEEV